MKNNPVNPPLGVAVNVWEGIPRSLPPELMRGLLLNVSGEDAPGAGLNSLTIPTQSADPHYGEVWELAGDEGITVLAPETIPLTDFCVGFHILLQPAKEDGMTILEKEGQLAITINGKAGNITVAMPESGEGVSTVTLPGLTAGRWWSLMGHASPGELWAVACDGKEQVVMFDQLKERNPMADARVSIGDGFQGKLATLQLWESSDDIFPLDLANHSTREEVQG